MTGWGSEEVAYAMDTPEFDVKKVEKELIKELQTKFKSQVKVRKWRFTSAKIEYSWIVYVDGKIKAEFLQGDETRLKHYLKGLGCNSGEIERWLK